MAYKNKEDQKAYFKKWYAENKEKFKTQVKQLTKERRIKNRQWLLNYKKSLSCELCGETHPYCLEFHHINDDKIDTISNMISNYSIQKIEKEIKKCKLLCANCHRKEHFQYKDIASP